MIKIVKSSEFDADGFISTSMNENNVEDSVREIISNVRQGGDTALRKLTEKYDGCKLKSFELKKKAIDAAVATVDPDFIEVMKRAAASIAEYHRNQINTGFDLLPKEGIILGQKVMPLTRVGCYIPGGSAPLPSSVLMNCIPARLAGVQEIILVTPPSSDNDVNGVDPRILAAAKIGGAKKIFTIGGAQAIAALAYGTKSVPRVDKITGPGNSYVTEAKRQVYGVVGIDMLAGPSDVLVIADRKTNPGIAAADMLSQCEHGADSRAVLLTDTMTLAKKVQSEIKKQLSALPRKTIAAKAIDNNSVIIVTATLKEAFDISNKLAPEHLIILLDEPFNYLSSVKNAGSVFLGKYTPETFGDYLAGPNHILPTNGNARFSSPLTVADFYKKMSYTYFTKEALAEKAPDAIRFAGEECLDAHARAVKKRLDL